VSYRLRKPVYAPADLTYTARVTTVAGDSLTLQLIEENPSGTVGFEGTVQVTKTRAQTGAQIGAQQTNGLVSAAGVRA
jgi:3-methylfumaryl-CoA hydratase